MQKAPEHDPPNLLGAVAVAAFDLLETACETTTGHGSETAAALVAIGHAPGLSNDGLGQVMGLSHPGTVRLVDRLSTAGLVERRQGTDRRMVSLHLSSEGHSLRAALLAERKTAMETLLAPLSAREQATLAGLLAKVLQAVPVSPLHGLSVCRLCDEQSCRNCPIDAGVARSCIAG